MSTDNSSLATKVALRRRLIDSWLAQAPSPSPQAIRVLDCCNGSGVVWNALRKHYPCRVTGLDLKAAPGRLKIASERFLLGVDLSLVDVIDIDTYGSPFLHVRALLQNWTAATEKGAAVAGCDKSQRRSAAAERRRTDSGNARPWGKAAHRGTENTEKPLGEKNGKTLLVFLTYGSKNGANLSKSDIAMTGAGFASAPRTVNRSLRGHSIQAEMSRILEEGITVEESLAADTNGSHGQRAQYFALRLSRNL